MSNQLSVEDKFAKVLINLRKIRPFYSSVYESLKRVENTSIKTMGVSVNEMVYNPDFVDKLSFEELMFVSLHEVAHVALMHVSRQGRRDATLWNIACDLYVNKLLADEFNVRPGKFSLDNSIKFMSDALYCESIDLENDYAEQIYEELYDQANNNGYNTENDNKLYKFHINGSGVGDGCDIEVDKDNSYRDIIDNGSDPIEKENENKRILSEAKTRFEMNNNNVVGTDTGLLKFKVDEILKSHLDWRKLLRKYCIKIKGTDTSFSNPDKRMFYQEAIYPGQRVDESSLIKGIKVCIDSSGSISNKDISYFYGQILGILKQFKIDAELIYWDTEIASCGSFMNIKEMKHVTAAGRGGTDPSCLFEYFDSKKCKIKPVVTLIFTDGYIYDLNENNKWKRKYKDTIWIMTRNYNKMFEQPFGKKAIAKFE